MDLEHLTKFGVSGQLLESIQRRGITHLYPVQLEAIERGLHGKNLVVTSPPGSGKTLIGEVLGFQRLIANASKKTVFLFPLRALARQKFLELFHHYGKLGFQISYSTGEVELTPDTFEITDVLVATYERFDSFLRSYPDYFPQVGTLMCDEIHTVGSPHRGPRLEALLTRLLEAAESPQLIGLSATIANPESIANWLDAELVVSTERLPLHYRLLISDNKFSTISKILVKHLRTEQQVLIFVNTRAEAEALAVRLAKTSHKYISRAKFRQITEWLATDFLPQLEDPTTPMASKLLGCVRKGIGWHHAGLAAAVRIAVEEAFALRYLLILTATPTLAAGLNLPASAVIIRDLKLWNKQWISANAIHQRAGRAGRPMLDTEGYAVLLASDETELGIAQERYFVQEEGQLQPKYEPISSYLAGVEALQEQILTRIVQCGTASRQDVVKMFEKSLWWAQQRETGVTEHLEAYLFPATPQYILRLRGYRDPKTKSVRSKLLQMSAERVRGLITMDSTHYTVSFDLKRGAYCSCSRAASLLRQGVLCEHLSHLANRILRSKTNPFYPPIVRTLHEFSPIYYLKAHDLIQELEGEQYRATQVGRLAAQLYLKPATMVLIRDSILTQPLKTQREALHAVLRTLHQEKRAKNAPLEETVAVLEKWLKGLPYPQLLEDSPILYSRDLEDLVEAVTWVLSCLSKILVVLDERWACYADELRVLAKRMSKGLPENAVELQERLGISREKAMALVKGGIRSFEELARTDLTELTKIPGIGRKTVQVIQQALTT